MSYCVNCGVELKDSEKTCPLCDVEVQNPRAPWKEPAERPYPGRLEPVLKRADRRFFATLATLILCIPVAVTLLSDLLTDGMLTWSGYVAGAMALLFVWVILPLYCKRYYLLRLLSIDCLATLAYLKLIEYASRGTGFCPLPSPSPSPLACSFCCAPLCCATANGSASACELRVYSSQPGLPPSP